MSDDRASDGRFIELTEEFDAAFRALAAARVSYESTPRDPQRIAELGAARTRLDTARAAMSAEREQLGLDPPWRLQPAPVEGVDAPPLWSIDTGPNA